MGKLCPLARQESSNGGACSNRSLLPAATVQCHLECSSHSELAQAASTAIMSRPSNSTQSCCVATLQIRWVTVPICMWKRKLSCWSAPESLGFGSLSCVARNTAVSPIVNRKFRKHAHTSVLDVDGQSVGLRTSRWWALILAATPGHQQWLPANRMAADFAVSRWRQSLCTEEFQGHIFKLFCMLSLEVPISF